ncbi:PREDICTED: zinc finger BED domain-containing protein RICESLEEPER 2-like [Camelina sativa]|uniref:Zinc finger BED domain-containing protein RICESLEEPER 2-like n=1 Tax=Camelina sativa TaxID=90675 RepID=A0ABM0SKE0_CAMSA|nr:PREDICTED: zinc finger BED domain-containing protein RICESLEEPER 2-like [Camelina sativa]
MKGEFMHVRCAGHIINLIVRDGLTEVSENLLAIRNAISYFRSHSNRQNAFDQKIDSVRMTRGRLPLDVKTRWNSTYLMLQRAIKYKVAFDKMETEDKLYNDHFLEIDNGKKRVGPRSFNDWRAVERLDKFLEIFYNSILIVSASTKLNSHKCYGEIVNISTNLDLLCSSYDSELKIKAEEMYKKFDKYWDGISNIKLMLIIATIFDPSKKLHFAKICFAELYGAETPTYKEMYDKVYNLRIDMFKEYSDRYAKSQPSQSSQSSPSSQSQPFQSSQPDVSEADSVPRLFTIDKRYKAALNEIGVQVTKDELTTYLKEAVENPDVMMGTECDVLSWWKVNCGKYPILSQMARDVFAMQVSSIASESAFSTSGRIIKPCRSCLTPYMVEVLMCTEQWMKQDIAIESRVLTNAQILAEVQYEDQLEKEFCIEV